MLRCRRPSAGAFSVLCSCALGFSCSCACSSTQAGADEASVSGGSGAASFGGVPAGSTTPAGGSVTNAGGSFGGDDAAAVAGSSDEASAAGASSGSGSGARTLFYLDVQGRVLSFDEDQPTPRTLVRSAGQGPDGIAVDVTGGHIFWTTMGVPADDDGSLRRANLDGSGVSTIVAVGDTYTPKQLKLDAAGNKLYWSDREGMRIQRAALDGSGLETLVSVASGSSARKDAANWCVGLALDVEHGFVYWTQKGPDNGMAGSIRRAHLELPAGDTAAKRSDVELLFEGLPEPVDLELDVSNGYMYWSDRGDDTINRAPMEIPDGSSAATRIDREIIVPGVREAIGVALDVERGHVYFTSAMNGRVGRANLDGSAALDLVSGTGALTGIAVIQLANH